MPAVSVLMPCRDAASTVDEAVASLVAQTFRDFEILAIDDGSTDATRARLDAWAARDARLRPLTCGRAGIVSALQTGVARASGVLIARMDADDIAHPERLARQVALLASQPDVAACGTGVRYFPEADVRAGARRYERWLNGLVTPEAVARDIFVECPLAHPALVIRREALERAGGWHDPGWPEDYDLVLRAWAGGARLANVPAVLLRWRERLDRLSRTSDRYAPDAFRRCKAHYLARTLLRGRSVLVIGCGPVGKAFARTLLAQGTPLAAFVDVDPRKIGQTVHGVPVVGRADLGRFRDAFAVGAVAGPGPRAEIRAWLDAAGWREMTDYCAVA